MAGGSIILPDEGRQTGDREKSGTIGGTNVRAPDLFHARRTVATLTLKKLGDFGEAAPIFVAQITHLRLLSG
jgi:hypothetical protein